MGLLEMQLIVLGSVKRVKREKIVRGCGAYIGDAVRGGDCRVSCQDTTADATITFRNLACMMYVSDMRTTSILLEIVYHNKCKNCPKYSMA